MSNTLESDISINSSQYRDNFSSLILKNNSGQTKILENLNNKSFEQNPKAIIKSFKTNCSISIFNKEYINKDLTYSLEYLFSSLKGQIIILK